MMYDEDYTFNTLSRMLNTSPELIESIKEIEKSRSNGLWIIRATLYCLSDEFKPLAGMKVDTVAMMARMLVRFNKSSMKASIDNDVDFDFKEMINYLERPVYYVNIGGVYREASMREVNEGVTELENRPEKALDHETERLMYILTWAVTGLYRYYTKAGYTCTYKDNEMIETDCQQILAAMHGLRAVADWLDNDALYERAKNSLISMKRKGKYKYPEVVNGEIEPEGSIRFVVVSLNKSMPYTRNPILLKCRSILKRMESKKYYKLNTEEKITLRKGYNILSHVDEDIEQAGLSESDRARVAEVKYSCERIEQAYQLGRLSKSDWGYKVSTTIASNKYLRCSDKQLRILKDTCEKLDKEDKEAEQAQKCKDAAGNTAGDFDISSFADLLGEGLLGLGSDSLP